MMHAPLTARPSQIHALCTPAGLAATDIDILVTTSSTFHPGRHLMPVMHAGGMQYV
jgi:hypothetical protein